MLVDAFLYNGEEDILELRYQTLRDHVDMFLLVEGNQTFTGKRKDITHVPYYQNMEIAIVDNFPFATFRNAWKRESYQRNQILKHLPKDILPNDIIMVSDVDEIPNPAKLNDGVFDIIRKGEVGVFEQEWYQFNFNNRVKDIWRGTRICTLENLWRHYPQGVRNYHSVLIPDGGWHFSWFWRPQEKLHAYSHIELQGMLGSVQERVKEKWPREYEFIDGTRHLPKPIQQYPSLWEQYFYYGMGT